MQILEHKAPDTHLRKTVLVPREEIFVENTILGLVTDHIVDATRSELALVTSVIAAPLVGHVHSEGVLRTVDETRAMDKPSLI